MLIKIQEVNGPFYPSGKKYQQIDVVYSSGDSDENKTRKIFSFGDGKPVFEALKDGNFGAGDSAEVRVVKNGKFWDWVGIESASGEAQSAKPTSASTNKSGKVNWNDREWETADERYRKNKAICRQNALTNAVTIGSLIPGTTPKEILDLADQFFYYTTQDFLKEEEYPKLTAKELKQAKEQAVDFK